jgi:DICT domain-containing protein
MSRNTAAMHAMIDQLLAVAAELDPSIIEPSERERLWEYINAFLVHAMKMEPIDFELADRVFKTARKPDAE